MLAAWRRLAVALRGSGADVVLAHPCQFLQAPPALLWTSLPTVYFCHEPRRVDHDPAARLTRNPRTRLLYLPLHRAERAVDRRSTAAASRLVTNSRFTARQIRAAYGREATPVPLGVPDRFRPGVEPGSAGARAERRRAHPDQGPRPGASRPPRWPRAAGAVLLVAPRHDPDEERRLRALAGELGVELDVRTADLRGRPVRGLPARVRDALPRPRRAVRARLAGGPGLRVPRVVADEGGLPETIVPGVTGWAVAAPARRGRGVAWTAWRTRRRARRSPRAPPSTARAARWDASAAAMAAVLEQQAVAA